MCGINGIYNFKGKSIPDGKQLIQNMNNAIFHRGPDDSGYWKNNEQNIFLGHQRLSILDLSENGRQPMKSFRENFIVYNGEVYNFRSLKKRFESYSFISETDTEVLLYLYEEDKEKFLDEINGMFAFAIWDAASREITLARDRIGIKPLYYATVNDIFAFSSEIKAILTLPWVNAEIDENALYHFLTFNKVFPPQTMFRGIYKFYPGYKMVVGKKGIQEYEAFWRFKYKDYSSISETQIKETVYRELSKSVSHRLVSDVPVGAFLSGGVDSSAIVSLINKNTSGKIKTFSVGFENAPKYDELAYDKSISKKFNTEHIETIITPDDINEFIPKMAEIFDEPLADATSIPLYFISKLAKDNETKVVLTGDGADELFCGYDNWLRYVRLFPLFYKFSLLPKQLKLFGASIYGRFKSETPYHEMLFRAANKHEFFWGSAGGIKESEKDSILSDSFKERMADVSSHDTIIKYRKYFEKTLRLSDRKKEYIDWMTFLGLMQIIPNYYLYRAD